MTTTSPSRKRTIIDAGSYEDRTMAAPEVVVGGADGSAGLRRRRVGSGSDDDVDDDGSPLPSPPSPPSSPPPSPPDQFHHTQQQQSVVPLSMQLMRPFWMLSCCPECSRPNSFGGDDVPSVGGGGGGGFGMGGASFGSFDLSSRRHLSMASISSAASNGGDAAGQTNGDGAMASFQRAANLVASNGHPNPNASPGSSSIDSDERATPPRQSSVGRTSVAPFPFPEVPVERLLREYAAACDIYGCSPRINPGVLTTFRFSLPTLRVSGNFHDADMLALAEVLLRHCNGALSHVRRIDFTVAAREGKSPEKRKGLRSHGAYALSKVLARSAHVEEVYLSNNRIGPYGGAAVFQAAAENARSGGKLRTALMRGCRVGERGAMAFAKEVRAAKSAKGAGLREVDLSVNRIGCRGCYAIEEALREREDAGGEADVAVNLEGNMIFQEVMNCVTHGLGILLGTVGTYLLTDQVSGLPSHYTVSCAVYSASLIVLYGSSTLYHSFFALRTTKHIFKVFDKCAIYLLIAGSYTPFLTIALHHKPLWSMNLLAFIWVCAIGGVVVEAVALNWEHKGKFSLAMYLGMGWSCLVCLPDLVEVVPRNALALLVAGGVSYTGGVPFFVRNNNLDHSIWHLFVLAGSIFHWLSVYWYVAIPSGTV